VSFGQPSFVGKVNMLRILPSWFSKPRLSELQGSPVIGFKIRLYAICDEAEIQSPTNWIVDIADFKQRRDMLRGIENLCFVEARAVGESTDAVEVFRGLMVGTLGYRQGPDPRPGSSWLFHAGDESYPEEFPFVFLCPIPDPSLTEEGVPPRPTAYEPNFELFVQKQRELQRAREEAAPTLPSMKVTGPGL
jgi:hypothetical protein